MRLRVALGGAVMVGVAMLASGAVRPRAPLEALRSAARAEGITVEARSVERGLFQDTLHDVRASLPGGAVVRAREATLSRSPLFAPSLGTPVLEVTFTGDPLRAFSQLGRVAVPSGLALRPARVAVHYHHRATGVVVLDGVTERSGGGPLSLHAESIELGAARFSDVAFSVARKRASLEIVLGADREAPVRATATYVPSDGRAAEWRIVLPHRPLGELRRALGHRTPVSDDAAARIAGTLSWIVPEDVRLPTRGSCRFVLDGWPRPPWPDASALTGSSGAIAAAIAPSPVNDELRLERVEVSAALFDLRGNGTITLGGAPRIALSTSGRRTCAELSRGLPPSRHREAVRSFLGPGALGALPASNAAGRAEDWVELSLRVELELGATGDLRFLWHLSPGCGLPEMTVQAAEGG